MRYAVWGRHYAHERLGFVAAFFDHGRKVIERSVELRYYAEIHYCAPVGDSVRVTVSQNKLKSFKG